MNSDGDWFLRVDLAFDESKVVSFINVDLIEVTVEFTEVCGELDKLCAVYEFLFVAAMGDDLCNGTGF